MVAANKADLAINNFSMLAIKPESLGPTSASAVAAPRARRAAALPHSSIGKLSSA